MVDVRALVGIVIFSAVETVWIGLVLMGVFDIPFLAIYENFVLALIAFLVLVEEHIIAHNVGQGMSFPRYLGLPRRKS